MNRLTQAALEIARSYVGVRETGGNNRGPQVEEWLRRVGLGPGLPWCMAFAWCCVDDAFKRLELPNPIRPTGGVVKMWLRLPGSCKLMAPIPGCWAFHQSDENPAVGHVGFIDELAPNGGAFSIEGNTNADGSRTGGGVWRHTPSRRPLGFWNLGFADYSALAAACIERVPG